MKVPKELLFCPDCGKPLELSYIDSNGMAMYHCPAGDEDYYFEVEGEYLYIVCDWDGKRTCLGLATQLDHA